nr:uncharacterized protein LOC128682944 [Plodia interpunctella]
MLAQLVEDDHTSWPKKLPVIRFALNNAKCRTTGKSPAYLTFGREMRSPTEVTYDLRAIMDKDNFVPQITPYLSKFLNSLSAIRERVEGQQDKNKEYADAARRPSDDFKVGDLVMIKSHLLSKGGKNLTAKFYPRRDGPYRIAAKISPTTFAISSTEKRDITVGRYHSKDLSRYQGDTNEEPLPKPINPKKGRGRPSNPHKPDTESPVQERGRSPGLEGECIVNHRTSDLPTRASRGRLPTRYRE